MIFPRRSGILFHPTSLPGAYGVGDFGKEAYGFVDFLQAAGHKLWQVLPLNPTGYGDSPFQCFSSVAGNPLLISLDHLVESGALSAQDVANPTGFPVDKVDFGAAFAFKIPVLTKVAQNILGNAGGKRQAFEDFCRENAGWLDDFALFIACKNAHGGVAWPQWNQRIACRDPRAVQEWTTRLVSEIEIIKFWQFEFFRQWQALHSYAHQRGIQIIGDIPIYVAHDSADVWANREFFHLDAQGNPTKVAGVPPDYFSATGQLWGNPIYNWERLRSTGYKWWIERFRAALRLYDIVRIDHFRGF